MRHDLNIKTRKLLAAAAINLLIAGSVAAQTNHVEFRLPGSSAEGDKVPTLDGQSMSWDSAGNLVVTCLDSDADDYCDGTVGKTTGAGDGAAVLNYFRFSGGSSTVNIGASDPTNVTLQWEAATGADVCKSSLTAAGAGSNPTTWNEILPTTGNKTFTLSASADIDLSYEFAMTCYNESGSDATTGTLLATATVVKRETPVTNDECPIVKGVGAGVDPLFQPDGFVQHIIPWSTVFYYEGTPSVEVEYPNLREAMYPVGSWTLGNLPGLTHGTSMKGRYISIPFVADTTTQNFQVMKWWAPIYRHEFPLYNPINRQARRLRLTISPCAGDFRAATNFGNGPADGSSLWSACRKSENQGSISYGKNYCQVQNGKTYYINLLYSDPADGLTPTETDCNSPSGVCDVMFE